MKSALSAPQLQNEEAAVAYVEAKLWPHGPVCPKCGVIGQAGRLQGKSNRPGLWKCYACRQPFTVRMGTVFEVQPRSAASLAPGRLPDVLFQEGHQHPPNPADPRRQHEDRMVPWSPRSRGYEEPCILRRWARRV